MRRFSLLHTKSKWKILTQTKKTQAALMTLKYGETEGGANDMHPLSDQWMYVISGKGAAIINKKRIKLLKGDLVLIKAKEKHTIVSDTHSILKTINFYGPPASFDDE